MYPIDKQNAWNSTFILHKSLLDKNQQLKACVEHLRKLPHDRAIKQLTTISQGLVTTQKVIQEVDMASVKLHKESVNLNMDTRLLKWPTKDSDMATLP